MPSLYLKQCSPRLPVQSLLTGGGWEPLGCFSTDSCGQVHILLCFVFSQLCCPLRLQNSPQTRLWEGFLLFGNFSSFMTPSPGQITVPNSFFLSFCLLYFVLPPFEENGLPFWVPDALCQHSEVCGVLFCFVLFLGICSAFKWTLDELVGEKVVSLS